MNKVTKIVVCLVLVALIAFPVAPVFGGSVQNAQGQNQNGQGQNQPTPTPPPPP